MILIYLAGGIFPIILSGYHSYLSFWRNGATTNESCKGIKRKSYLPSKRRNNIWDPRAQDTLILASEH